MLRIIHSGHSIDVFDSNIISILDLQFVALLRLFLRYHRNKDSVNVETCGYDSCNVLVLLFDIEMGYHTKPILII